MLNIHVPLGKLGTWIVDRCRLPRRGNSVPVRLEVTPCGDGARWVRRFGDQIVESHIAVAQGRVEETSGNVKFAYQLSCEDGAVRYRQLDCWINGQKRPRWLSPQVSAVIKPDGIGWHVDVSVRLPILGTICRYGGKMEAV